MRLYGARCPYAVGHFLANVLLSVSSFSYLLDESLIWPSPLATCRHSQNMPLRRHSPLVVVLGAAGPVAAPACVFRVFSSMQAIELRPVGLHGSRCRSGEAPGPYTSCNCWACCAGSLSLFAFSQPPRDIRSGSGISAGWGWLVKGCVGAVRAGYSYSTAFLA